MAKVKVQQWMLREEDLQELEDLQKELQERVNKASDNGSILLMQVYTVFLAQVSTEVRRTRARFDRDNLASVRKNLKDLKTNHKPQDTE